MLRDLLSSARARRYSLMLALVLAGALGVLFRPRRREPFCEKPYCRVEEGLYLGSSAASPGARPYFDAPAEHFR